MSELLTPNQEAFCQAFAVSRSGPLAYQASYNCGPGPLKPWMASEASKLLRDPKITGRISELQRIATAETRGVIDLQRIQQLYLDVVNVDPNELTSLRIGCCRYCWGEGHGYHWREQEYFDALNAATLKSKPLPDIAGGFGYKAFELPHVDCPQCDGEGEPRDVYMDTRYLSPGAKFLFKGVKRTKTGIEVLFGDREKALENLGRILGAFKDGVTLTGQIGLAAALAQVTAGDAQDAASVYEQFLKAGTPDDEPDEST